MPMLTAPHSNPDLWYPGSVSHGLRSLAAKGNTILPPDLYQELVDAAGRVYIHEAYVNELRVNTPCEQPIHRDPFFVYNGYRSALSDLMKTIARPENQWDSLRFRTCTGLSVLLHDMLVVLRAEGMDTYRLYKNAGYAVLLAEFERAVTLR